MASSTDEFAARARSVFGALGEPESVAWKLDPQQGFKAGAEDGQDSSEEEEGAGPQPLEGATGSDEEGIEEAHQYRMKASCAYVRAFEQEADEDEFDRQAAGSSDEGSRPLRSMEVLEDNAFDRMHNQQYSQQHRAAHAQQACMDKPVPAAGAGSTTADTAAAAMVVDEDLPALEPPATASAAAVQRQQHAAALQLLHNSEQAVDRHRHQQQQAAQRPRAGLAEVWVPPHRRPDNKSPDEAAEVQQQHNGLQQHRRVRFDGPLGQQQQQHDRGTGGYQQRGRVRGRGRFHSVPDHVKNPHKYTVYTLDEPLYVGQGAGDDRDNQEAAAAAAAVLGSRAAVRSSSSSSRDRTGRGATLSSEQEECATDWLHHATAPMLLDEDELVRPSVHSVAAAAADGAAVAPVLPPAAGVIKFHPRSKRICGDALENQSESKDVPAATTVPVNVAKHLGAFTEDDDPSSAAVVPIASHHTLKGTRNYRKRHMEEEDA